MFYKKGILKKTIFAGLRSATSLKKRLRHKCFSVNFAEYLRTSFSQNTFGETPQTKYKCFRQNTNASKKIRMLLKISFCKIPPQEWCTTDKDNTTGFEIDNFTTTAGYSQMINKPTHFINELSSFIDLIISSNTSFVKDCGSEMSIYEKCHHNIIYVTLHFDVPLPPSYY